MLNRMKYWRDERGVTAAEFALVIVPFMALIFGIIGMSMLFHANQSLHFAVEAAARCYSVNTAVCSTSGDTQTYATSKYTGPAISPVFIATATGCGHTVTGSATFPLNAVLVSISVPLSASACFP